jgi:hypothetical protein
VSSKVTEARSRAADIADQLLKDAQASANDAITDYKHRASFRVGFAYVIKGIALFGGLVVATTPFLPHILGFIISAAVLTDQLMSNQKRMITYKTAQGAVDRTQRRVGNAYNDRVVQVGELEDAGDAPVALKLKTELANTSAKTLRDELDKIRDAVQKDDLQYLATLNVNNPPQTPPPTGP